MSRRPPPPGFVGMYPEPIPETCYNAVNAKGEEFWDEWQAKNNALDADARRRAQEAMKDPNNTCGDSMSPATATDENDCWRELYEPEHDQMIRDLIAKYDCAPGGAGAATPASAKDKAAGGGASGGSSKALMYGLGALAVAGIGYAVYRTKYANNPVPDQSRFMYLRDEFKKFLETSEASLADKMAVVTLNNGPQARADLDAVSWQVDNIRNSLDNWDTYTVLEEAPSEARAVLEELQNKIVEIQDELDDEEFLDDAADEDEVMEFMEDRTYFLDEIIERLPQAAVWV
jgi:hypothetical protein